MKTGATDPVLILSQDYELFFKDSGTIEKCLIEPSELLLKFARANGTVITFFIDSGMLRCFDKYARTSSAAKRAAADVRQNLRRISSEGHELALHVHPHWEDTRLIDGQWDFTNTRYQLRDFSDDQISDIFHSNFRLLQELSNSPIRAYRAGGFCIEPFHRISAVMNELGIDVESSVVPGASLVDPDKGFDFALLPDEAWWYFNDTPLKPEVSGRFIEIPITPCIVSPLYYWGRVFSRLMSKSGSGRNGGGVSKAIGKAEILRRLFGGSRTSELSIDSSKVHMLASRRTLRESRDCWHLMGHPKLLSERSLIDLGRFISARNLRRSVSVTALAREIRAASS